MRQGHQGNPSGRRVSPHRPLIVGAAWSLLAAAALSILGILDPISFQWWRAHGHLAIWGALLPGLWGVTWHALARLGPRAPDAGGAKRVAVLMFAGAGLMAIGTLIQPSGVLALVAYAGVLATVAATVLATIQVMKVVPKRSETTVDMERDPLTKGDDACWSQVRFAHFLLVPGTIIWALSWLPALSPVMAHRLSASGLHVVLGGHALFLVYATTHLWVPRLSGVPAIAAGAIKGELHSGLLGVLGIAVAHAIPDEGIRRGLLVAFGPFLFLSFFTYMGVIGANIMRNKSQTHRVTPEFSYIPWTFSAVFWMVSGVLLGLFMSFTPDALASYTPALRATHVHIMVLGGMVQAGIGLAMRLLARDGGTRPPPFHRHRLAFLVFNGGMAWLVVGFFTGSPLGGAVAATAGLLATLPALRAKQPARAS